MNRVSGIIESIVQGRKIYFWTAFVFVFSRIIFNLLGVEFDSNPIYWYHQYLDFELLKNNLLESVWYLHSQPPLFNLFLGTIAKLFADSFDTAFHIIYISIGLLNGFMLIYILRYLSVKDSISFSIALIFVISPAAILYENWLFYTYPVQFFLLLSATAFVNALKKKTVFSLFSLFAVLALIILTRSLFNIIWFVLIFAFMFFSKEFDRKTLLKSAAIPLAIILFVLIKNIMLFGTIGSSWFGMSMAKVTMKYIPDDKQQELVDNEGYDPIILIKPFGHVKEYHPKFRNRKYDSIPSLNDKYKSSGEPNYNNINYIDISNIYLNQSLKVFQDEPSGFIKAQKASWYLYFRSASDYRYFHNNNREQISLYDTWWNRIFYGQINNYSSLTDEQKEFIKTSGDSFTHLLSYTGLYSVLFFIIFLIVSYFMLFKPERLHLESKHRQFLIYLLLNILYISLIGNSFETDENNRFRFLIEPFYLIIVGVIFNKLIANKLKNM